MSYETIIAKNREARERGISYGMLQAGKSAEKEQKPIGNPTLVRGKRCPNCGKVVMDARRTYCSENCAYIAGSEKAKERYRKKRMRRCIDCGGVVDGRRSKQYCHACMMKHRGE